MTENMETAIREYIAERMTEKLEVLFKKRDGLLKKVQSSDEELELKSKYAEEEETLRERFLPRNWLSDASKRAKQISLVTHAVKFTHSSAKGTNILHLVKDEHPQYLDSSCIAEPIVDAVGNAAALDVAKLLQLETKSDNLLGLLAKNDSSALKAFSLDEAELKKWVEGFLLALSDTSPASHTLAKQVYFPVGNGAYHLLSPLYSSSLSQEIYNRIQFTRYSKESKEIRKSKRDNKYSPFPVVSYPNIAVTISGGSKPQNISQKNSGRGGRTYLLPNSPPKWDSQVTPPVYLKNFFSFRELNWQTNRTIKQLAKFLEKVVDRDSNQRIRNYRSRLVNEIIDTVFNLSLTMGQLPIGWTEQAALPAHQKVWLDPHKPEHQDSNSWCKPVAFDFAQWLNNRLKKISSDKLLFAKTESEFWQDTFIKGIDETKFGRRR